MNESTLSSRIADRLNWLFDNIPGSAGRSYSHQDVENGTAALGYRVTTSTVWSIRHGKTPNPGMLTMAAIAAFFGVESTFFLLDSMDQEALELIRTRAEPEDPVVAEILQRVSSMEGKPREALLALLRLIGPVETPA